jgi:hypothetical protein
MGRETAARGAREQMTPPGHLGRAAIKSTFFCLVQSVFKPSGRRFAEENAIRIAFGEADAL